LGGSAAVLLVLGLGIAGSINAEDPGELPRLIAASPAYAPALWVFAGLAAALFGVAPRFVGAAWGVLGALAFVGFMGPLLRFPDWVFNLSPLGHVLRMPVEEFSVVPELILTVIAGALVAAALVAFRGRDLANA